MPYLVAFGILLAVLSFCALSRRAEDDAFLVKPSSSSLTSSYTITASASSASTTQKKAARTARPPELSPQARSSGQSPLICLCPQLVVPEKVECNLLVPQVSSLANRGSKVQVSDMKGGQIFLLEVLPFGQSKDGTRPCDLLSLV